MNPLLSLTPIELPVLESQARSEIGCRLGAPACEKDCFLVATVLVWAARDMAPALFLTPFWLYGLERTPSVQAPIQGGNGTRTQTRPPKLSRAHLLLLPLSGDRCMICQPHAQPSSPHLCSLCLPSCSAASAYSPHAVRYDPRHRQPHTAADRQRRTAALSWQLPRTWPEGPTETPSSPTVMETLPRSLRGPGAGLGRRPLSRSLTVGVLAENPTPIYHRGSGQYIYLLSHWDRSDSLNSSQGVLLPKTGPSPTRSSPPWAFPFSLATSGIPSVGFIPSADRRVISKTTKTISKTISPMTSAPSLLPLPYHGPLPSGTPSSAPLGKPKLSPSLMGSPPAAFPRPAPVTCECQPG